MSPVWMRSAMLSAIHMGLFEATMTLLIASTHRTLIDRDLSQQLEITKHFPRSEDHARQRILRQRDRQAGLFANSLIEILDERPATGKHDTAIGDVRGKLGRRALQNDANRIDDDIDALVQRLANFFIGHDDALRYTLHEIAAFDFHCPRLIERMRGPDLDLDLLGRALADQKVVFSLDVLRDCLVHFVAGNLVGAAVDTT